MALFIPKHTYPDDLFISINISAPLIFQGETMKAMTAIMMILIFSLGLVGCVTTQSGSGGNGGATSGKMLTDEDYKRIGVKETGVR